MCSARTFHVWYTTVMAPALTIEVSTSLASSTATEKLSCSITSLSGTVCTLCRPLNRCEDLRPFEMSSFSLSPFYSIDSLFKNKAMSSDVYASSYNLEIEQVNLCHQSSNVDKMSAFKRGQYENSSMDIIKSSEGNNVLGTRLQQAKSNSNENCMELRNSEHMVFNQIIFTAEKQTRLELQCRSMLKHLHRLRSRQVISYVRKQLSDFIPVALSSCNLSTRIILNSDNTATMSDDLYNSNTSFCNFQNMSVCSTENEELNCDISKQSCDSWNKLQCSKTDSMSLRSHEHYACENIFSEAMHIANRLKADISLLQKCLDSDATDSSSGDDSSDDIDQPSLQQSSCANYIKNKWMLAKKRGLLATQWTWLLAQVSDIEYQIHQYSNVYNELCNAKNNVCVHNKTSLCPMYVTNQSYANSFSHIPRSYDLFSKSLHSSSFKSQTIDPFFSLKSELKTKSHVVESEESCARSRSFLNSNFRHKVLKLSSMQLKLSKYEERKMCHLCNILTTKCIMCDLWFPHRYNRYCYKTRLGCRKSILDKAFHSVLSEKKDMSLSVQMDCWLNRFHWIKDSQTVLQKSVSSLKNKMMNSSCRLQGKNLKKLRSKSAALVSSTKIKNKYEQKILMRKQKKGLLPIFMKKNIQPGVLFPLSKIGKKRGIKKKAYVVDEGYKMPPYCVMQTHLSQNKSSEEFYKSSKIYFSEKKRRITDNGSFDINNIIIPYKVTSVTRIETPDYKEITTPKWRKVDDLETNFSADDNVSEFEDLSDAAFSCRHEPFELKERQLTQNIICSARRNLYRSNTENSNISEASHLCVNEHYEQFLSSFSSSDSLDHSLNSPEDHQTGYCCASEINNETLVNCSTHKLQKNTIFTEWAPRTFPSKELKLLTLPTGESITNGNQWCLHDFVRFNCSKENDVYEIADR